MARDLVRGYGPACPGQRADGPGQATGLYGGRRAVPGQAAEAQMMLRPLFTCQYQNRSPLPAGQVHSVPAEGAR
ncbi:hypothetical protein GCM10015535_69750 [Streptomyces gelaticus]|uniref:Uncharacterized protein n=1 Tax=Streptomyces gelaticus TaxID=285446 RepID=A0ABQ2WA91_9ACTN|nr:hypothetical protein GCM10015535_69750 [Streptomyces gelaticus]